MAHQKIVKQNWFETLSEALVSESLLETWDIKMQKIDKDQIVSYHAYINGQCRSISIYRADDGRYERPIHCVLRGCICTNSK